MGSAQTGILRGSPSQNFKTLFLSETSQTKAPTTLVELEKTGVTQTGNSSNENGSRASKLHKQDVLSFARLGFLLFSLYSSFSLFPVPLALAPTQLVSYSLLQSSFSSLSLLLLVADIPCHSTVTFKMLFYHNSESGNWFKEWVSSF